MNGVVRAAGGIILRQQPEGQVELVVVHRPSYDDWTFPKGKLQVGEREEHTAIREVEEETGLRCRLERALGSTKYDDHRGRRKVVHYWVMRALEGHFRPSREVDELRWVTIKQASSLLSYNHDRALLRGLGEIDGALISAGGERRGRASLRNQTSSTIYLVRHAKALARGEWPEPDELRPLNKVGRRQAEELVQRLSAFSFARIVSSPHVRCKETVEPLARERKLSLESAEQLAENTDADDVLAFIKTLGARPAVLCSHGDVIADLMTSLVNDGLATEGDLRWEKGSTWVLESDGDTFLYGRYLPAP
ncbi:MAG: NUDIX hydrolase [Candidatus Eremiobacteraeota bacterium]|nr:NUDIX hydrolase [Candidatus Eremiobacteraeota bacterium]MBV8365870.1 NUDIX hydrolase [Candidatus Eremiobacteraeota bacterium]